MDKSSYPTYTPKTYVDIPDWHDGASNECRGSVLSDSQLHTAYNDSTRKMSYHQDNENKPSHAHRGNEPVPEKNNNPIVSGYCSLVAMFYPLCTEQRAMRQCLPADTMKVISLHHPWIFTTLLAVHLSLTRDLPLVRI